MHRAEPPGLVSETQQGGDAQDALPPQGRHRGTQVVTGAWWAEGGSVILKVDPHESVERNRKVDVQTQEEEQRMRKAENGDKETWGGGRDSKMKTTSGAPRPGCWHSGGSVSVFKSRPVGQAAWW